MRYDVRRIKRVRTEEERLRRRLQGDTGAKFSARRLEMGGGYYDSPDYSAR